jgi:hypothetical protein
MRLISDVSSGKENGWSISLAVSVLAVRMNWAVKDVSPESSPPFTGCD